MSAPTESDKIKKALNGYQNPDGSYLLWHIEQVVEDIQALLTAAYERGKSDYAQEVVNAMAENEDHQHDWDNTLLLSNPPHRCVICGHTEFVA